MLDYNIFVGIGKSPQRIQYSQQEDCQKMCWGSIHPEHYTKRPWNSNTQSLKIYSIRKLLRFSALYECVNFFESIMNRYSKRFNIFSTHPIFMNPHESHISVDSLNSIWHSMAKSGWNMHGGWALGFPFTRGK